MTDESEPWTDGARLYELYYEEGLTHAEMADELGCGKGTIARWMRRHDIAPGEARRVLNVEIPPVKRGRELRGEPVEGER